jgi:Plasmid pRiA4b ORF-3-like protein
MAQNETLIIRAALEGKPSIYREVEIDSSKSLYNLAEAITSAFGFNFDHAFGFYSGLKPATMMRTSPRYELFADMGDADPGVLSVKKTKVAQAFPAIGHAMLFLFDYGDDWLFRVKWERTAKKNAKVRYPRIVATHGEAPEQYRDPENFDEDAPTYGINLATGERIELRKRGRKTD